MPKKTLTAVLALALALPAMASDEQYKCTASQKKHLSNVHDRDLPSLDYLSLLQVMKEANNCGSSFDRKAVIEKADPTTLQLLDDIGYLLTGLGAAMEIMKRQNAVIKGQNGQ